MCPSPPCRPELMGLIAGCEGGRAIRNSGWMRRHGCSQQAHNGGNQPIKLTNKSLAHTAGRQDHEHDYTNLSSDSPRPYFPAVAAPAPNNHTRPRRTEHLHVFQLPTPYSKIIHFFKNLENRLTLKSLKVEI